MLVERLPGRLADADDGGEDRRQSSRDQLDQIEKSVLLQTLDHHWKEHLATLDALRQVIHLRSYAQKKPIDEYKQEAFLLFERMLVAIREDVTRTLMRAQLNLQPPPMPELPDFITQHLDPFSAGDDNSFDIDAGTWVADGLLPPLHRHLAAACRPAAGRRRQRGRGAGQPQRAVPVRLWPQVQALPRADRVAPPSAVRLIDRTELRRAYRPDEEQVDRERLEQARLSQPTSWAKARPRPRTLVKRVRAHKPSGARCLPSRLRPRLATKGSR